ncbi:MAG TPA: SurA N-terminal domain-containing protein, partial [Rhodocyclaceae bacterium]|nr:SurA N-terminal domain-containing protein [Rhodocyclaceae bacterium]
MVKLINKGWRSLVLLGGLLLATATVVTAQETGVAARVNGVEISNFRLERYFDDFLKQRGRNLGTIRHPQAYKRLKREALARLIDRELLTQEAARRGIEIPAAEVAAAREQVAAGFKSRETFRLRLGDAGFDEARFDDYLRRDLMAQRALAALVGEASSAAAASPPVAPRELEPQVLQELRRKA